MVLRAGGFRRGCLFMERRQGSGDDLNDGQRPHRLPGDVLAERQGELLSGEYRRLAVQRARHRRITLPPFATESAGRVSRRFNRGELPVGWGDRFEAKVAIWKPCSPDPERRPIGAISPCVWETAGS